MKSFGNTKAKYGAKKATYMGLVFDSTYERDRYIHLCDLQNQGKISGLRRQTRFLLIPKSTKLVPKQLKTKVKYVEKVVEMQSLYHNDYSYKENDKYISEELKGAYTCKLPEYVLRRKLMVKKIYDHNAKGRSQWVFREVIFFNKSKITITDK